MDAADLEIWNHRLSQVAEEMGLALERSAFSVNIKERRDFSCALFDAGGRLLAQAAHIPVHLGSTGMAVRAVLSRLTLAPGQVAIVNDPYSGGTHLPDVTLVSTVHDATGAPLAHLACRAHHADVGGSSPGSMPMPLEVAAGEAIPEPADVAPAIGAQYRAPASNLRYRKVTLADEGVVLPPMLLTDAAAAAFAAASRSPDDRRGDLAAQRAALTVGARRVRELCERHGEAVLRRGGEALLGYGEALMRAALTALPDGIYAFADSLDDDGAGREDVAIRLRLTIAGDRAHLDFADSDDEVEGPLNCVHAVTVAAVLYALRLLLPADAPTNDGLLAPVTLDVVDGSILAARPPHAVAGGNVETSQRIVDVVLGALSQARADIPAASAGSMNNILFGFGARTYYETIAGGAGGGRTGHGASAVHTHMTNTRNTPVEALEHALPVRVRRYAVRRGSGGGGAQRGGDGVVREFELLEAGTVTLLGDRRRRPPYGLAAGAPGHLGEDRLERDGATIRLPSKVTFAAQAGDRITIATPGGGGWGDGGARAGFFADLIDGTSKGGLA